MDPTPHLEKLFGADDSGYIPPHHIVHLLKLAWSGGLPSEGLRAICWRVLLGLISPSDKCMWEKELCDMASAYQTVKSSVLPSLDKVSVDPLSSLSSGENQSTEWSLYYKNVDLINFIKCDLDRLYITGIPDEYFESPVRRNMLLGILLIWSFDHPVISYRQGMHEMAGYMLYCIELELSAWNVLRATASENKPANDPYGLLNALTEENIEAHTYNLFKRIMNELEPIYDPVSLTPKGVENQPFVVQFSAKVQEHYLRMLDSELCQHLEECHISAQIYGLRWCRLLLGREFTAENSLLFKLWDFLFACCYEAENFSNESLLDIDARPNINSVLASVRIAGHTQHSNEERRNTSSLGTVKHQSPNESSAPAVPQYECTPLLGALGDLMLAMMLHIREQMLEGDASTILGLLMHYPSMPSVTPILDYADMIKRGVIMGPPVKQNKIPAKKQNAPQRLGSNGGNSYNNAAAASPGGNMTWNLNGMRQKFLAVTSAMGNGINEIVNTLAEYSEDDDRDRVTAAGAGQHPNEGKTRRPSQTKATPQTTSQPTPQAANSVPVTNGKAEGTRLPVTVAPAAIVTPTSPPVPASPIHAETTFTTLSASTSTASTTKTNTDTAMEEKISTKSDVIWDSEKSTAGGRPPSVLSDPLSDLLAPVEPTPGPSPVPPITASHSGSCSPVLTGMGTSYKNMPAEAMQPSEDRDPFHLKQEPSSIDSILNSPSITGYNIRGKMFTKGWFPSSTSKSDRRSKRENRSSGGVDLHVLHSSLAANDAANNKINNNDDESSNDSEDSDEEEEDSTKKKLRRPMLKTPVDRNAIGDRLLDLADSLARPAYYHHLSETITAGRELEYEAAMRRDTVKKLRAIADVLAGLVSLDEFDARFPPAEEQPQAEAHMEAEAVGVEATASPVPKNKASVASPLPPVREASYDDDATDEVSRLSLEMEPTSEEGAKNKEFKEEADTVVELNSLASVNEMFVTKHNPVSMEENIIL